MESAYIYTSSIRDEQYCSKSSTQSKRRHLCCIVAIGSKWKLLCSVHGMLYLSAKRHRFIIWWEHALWKTYIQPAWMKKGGLMQWNVTVTCGTSKTPRQMVKHRMKGDLENHLKEKWFREAPHIIDDHPISAKDKSRLHQFGKKVLPGIFLGYVLFAGGFGKDIWWLQTLRSC